MKYGREVATVELHALNDFQFAFQAGAVFDGDHAFLANLVHRISNDLADGLVGIRRNRADLGDFLGGGAGLGEFLQFSDDGYDGFVDTALQIHRVHAGGNKLHAFLHNRLCQHGGGGGAVAGDVRSLGSNFLHHLRAHVFKLVLELDFLRDRHAVLGDGGGAEAALEHHIAAFGAQGYFDRVGQDIYAGDNLVPGMLVKLDVFCCHVGIS